MLSAHHQLTPVYATDLIDALTDSDTPPEDVDPANSVALRLLKVLKSIDCVEDCETGSLDQYENMKRIARILEDWKTSAVKGASAPKQLVFALEESYAYELEQNQLQLSALINEDIARASALRDACVRTGFSLFICAATKKVPGSVDKNSTGRHSRTSPWNTSVNYELKKVFDFDGQHVLRNVKIQEEDILQHDDVAHLDNNEDKMFFALLILPKEVFGGFSKSAIDEDESNVPIVLSYLLRKHQENTAETEFHSTFGDICSHILTHYERGPKRGKLEGSSYSINTIRNIAETSAMMKDLEYLRRAILCLRDLKDPDLFSTFRKILNSIALDDILDQLDACLSKFTTLETRFEALDAIFDGHFVTTSSEDRHKLQGLYPWAVKKIEELLRTSEVLSTTAFRPLMQFVASQGGDRYLLDKIIPTIRRYTNLTPFLILFLNGISKDPCPVKRSTQSFIYGDIVPLLAQHFDLLCWSKDAFRNAKKEISTKSQGAYADRIHISPIDGQQLAIFIDRCLSLSLRSEVFFVIEKLTDQFQRLDILDFQPTILPFLWDLARCLPKHGIAYDDSRLRVLYQRSLSTHLKGSVTNSSSSKLLVRDQFKSIDQETLKQLLGDQYQDIMGVSEQSTSTIGALTPTVPKHTTPKTANSCTVTPKRRPLGELSNNIGSPASMKRQSKHTSANSPLKRKAREIEVIDLTEDEVKKPRT